MSQSQFRWTRSLRFRLTVLYTCALATVVIAVAGIGCLAMQHALLAETDAFLTIEAQRIGSAIDSEDGAHIAPSEIQEALDAYQNAPRNSATAPGILSYDVVYTRLLDTHTGRVLAVSPSLGERPDFAAALDHLVPVGASLHNAVYTFAGGSDETSLRTISAPLNPAHQSILVQVAVPWDHTSDVLERLATVLGIIVPIVLLMSGIIGWFLVGSTLRPINRIVTEVDNLDAHTLADSLLPPPAESDSEVGNLVVTLNRMTSRLYNAFEAQRRFAEAQMRFAADASHELRTPLTILRGEIELSLSRQRTIESYQTTLTSAVEEIDRMSRIVEGLSFLARTDAGHISTDLPNSEVDLWRVFNDTVEELSGRAAAKSMDIAISADGAEPYLIKGKKAQIYQLARNLVDNAIKYGDVGGSVMITLKTEDLRPTVAVTDTGVGIAAEDLANIFDRFWRADWARSMEGSGLGLAICMQIVDFHQGKISVSSELGVGTTFTVSFPPA